MKLDVARLAKMAVLEARSEAEFAALSDTEQKAYALATASMETAAPVRPMVARPKPSPNKSGAAKKSFNRSVKQHFSTGRQLSSAHKKAISEGLKRWHAAHGNGNYNGHQRRHAINHINKHIQKRVDHHLGMHAQHKELGLYAKRKKQTAKLDNHRRRASHHLKMANHLKRALLPLPGKK